MLKYIINFQKNILTYLYLKYVENKSVDISNEKTVLSFLNLDKFDKVLFIGLNKKDLLTKYIKNNNYKNIEIYDPSSIKIEKSKNAHLNGFIPSTNSRWKDYYADEEFDTAGTFFEKDLRWIAYNKNKKFELKKEKSKLILSEKNPYDLLFLSLNGSELEYLKEIQKEINLFKIIKIEYSEFNIDSKTFIKDYIMYFKENDFEIFFQGRSSLVHLSKYNTELENKYNRIYYFFNKKHITKINYKNKSSYRLENYVDKKNFS
tara:strand:+ start:554 stop:1336 length:783 start_codon:yes stop_codon:yes gene_type:complete